VVGDILQPTHLLFILVVALLVLGPKRLPEVGKSLGKGLRDFRQAISGDSDDNQHPATDFLGNPTVQDAPPAPPPAPAATAQAAPAAEAPESAEATEAPQAPAEAAPEPAGVAATPPSGDSAS
jgi:sec-independent protein translocase protein TatA